MSGEVEAWRAWEVHGVGRVLRLFSGAGGGGNYLRRAWPTTRYMEALCRSTHAEGVPGEKCWCGIYSLATWEEVVRQKYASPGSTVAVGRLALAGRVVPGDRGFRAAMARPLELVVPFESWRLAAPLAEGYGIPVHVGRVDSPVDLAGLRR